MCAFILYSVLFVAVLFSPFIILFSLLLFTYIFIKSLRGLVL